MTSEEVAQDAVRLAIHCGADEELVKALRALASRVREQNAAEQAPEAERPGRAAEVDSPPSDLGLESATSAGCSPASAAPSARAVAEKFHKAYERLAPSFGYETRKETRRFDPESNNGKLMIAVCAELFAATLPQPETQQGSPKEDAEALRTCPHGFHGGPCRLCERDAAQGAQLQAPEDHPDISKDRK